MMRLSNVWKSLVIVLVLAVIALPALAQGPGEIFEPFDDPNLPGWEHNEHVSVEDGMLRLSPGGYAMVPGEWEDFTLNLTLQLSGEDGAAFIGYNASDVGTHALILWWDGMLFQHHAGEEITDLGDAFLSEPLEGMVELQLVVVGEQSVVSINGQPVAAIPDFDPLPGGGFVFEALGSYTIEIDTLDIVPGGELPDFDLGYGEPDEGEGEPSHFEDGQREVFEGFDNGRPAEDEGWGITEGWRFNEGIAHTEDEGQFLFAEGDWSDMTIMLRLLVEGETSVVFNANDEGTYFLHLLPDGIVLVPFMPWPSEDHEELPPLGESPVSITGDWHDLEIDVQENQIRVRVDGDEVLHAESPDIYSGSVGIINHIGSAELDYIAVLPPRLEGEDEPPSPSITEPAPLATLAPPAPQSQAPTGVCTASSAGNVNVRTAPSTQDPIVGILLRDVYLPVSGRNAANWYQVTFNGQTAWVSGDVTRLNGPCNNIPLVQGQTAPPPPAQPPGSGSTGSTGSTAADLAVTDIFPETPNGPMMFRITNNGPADVNARLVSNCTITRFDAANNQLSTNAQNPSHQVTLSAGQTAAFNTNFGAINTAQEGYDITCIVQMGGDTNVSNNSYSESIRPLLQATVLSADLVITDLFSVPAASPPFLDISMRITNNGPDALGNAEVSVSCSTTYHPYDGSATSNAQSSHGVTLTLNPGQTVEESTYLGVDTTTGWHEVQCTLHPLFDPNTGNNTYSETFPPPP